jgi:hypothetical protein
MSFFAGNLMIVYFLPLLSFHFSVLSSALQLLTAYFAHYLARLTRFSLVIGITWVHFVLFLAFIRAISFYLVFCIWSDHLHFLFRYCLHLPSASSAFINSTFSTLFLFISLIFPLRNRSGLLSFVILSTIHRCSSYPFLCIY